MKIRVIVSFCMCIVSLIRTCFLLVSQLRNVGANLCVDTKFRGGNELFGLETCTKDHPGLGGEQARCFHFLGCLLLSVLSCLIWHH